MAASSVRKRDLRLLIIDADLNCRRLLSMLLSPRGYVCSAVSSASDACQTVRTVAPDVIVLDWVFRDASGVGLASRLRAAAGERGRIMPIIALSVWDEPYEFSVREGLDGYYVKPTLVGDLDRAIRSRLRAMLASAGTDGARGPARARSSS